MLCYKILDIYQVVQVLSWAGKTQQLSEQVSGQGHATTDPPGAPSDRLGSAGRTYPQGDSQVLREGARSRRRHRG